MKRLHFKLTLEQPCASSAESVSEGGHATLPFVRGRSILGAVARRYADVKTAGLTWDLFFSGRVRFTDARPLDPGIGAPCLPIPLSWHAPKGRSLSDLVHSDAVWSDHVHVAGVDRIGGVGMARSGKQLGASGALIGVTTRAGLRTAVDHERQAAATGKLYGFEAIEAGTELGFCVDLDLEGAELAEAERLVGAALGAPLHFGRSRSAEFGRARAERTAPWPSLPEGEAVLHGQDAVVSVLCVSELVWHDPSGRVGALPAASDLGLPQDWRLDASRTFTAQVRWAPFNAHTRRREVERVALAPGSVVTFRGSRSALDLEATRAACSKGIGAHRSEGLGRVLVQPAILCEKTEQAARARAFLPASQTPTAPAPAPRPQGLLGGWLHEEARRSATEAGALEAAEEFLARFPERAKRPGRRWPSVSQWRRVSELGRRQVGTGPGARDRLLQELEDLTSHGVSKHQWGANLQRGQSMQGLLFAALAGLADADRSAPLRLALIGGHVAHALNSVRDQGDS